MENYLMADAPFSWTVKAQNGAGFEEMFTVRGVERAAWFAEIKAVKDVLAKAGYTPVVYGRKPQAEAQAQPQAQPVAAPVVTPPQPQPQAEPVETVPLCPECGSECYDNRENRKPDDKRPLIKCKNAECEYRVWPSKKAKKA